MNDTAPLSIIASTWATVAVLSLSARATAGPPPAPLDLNPSFGTVGIFSFDRAGDQDWNNDVVTGFTDNPDRTVQRFGIARFIGLENALFIAGFEGGGL